MVFGLFGLWTLPRPGLIVPGERGTPLPDANLRTASGLAPIPLAYYVDTYVAAKRMCGQLGANNARLAQRNLHLFCRFAPADPRLVQQHHIVQFVTRPDVLSSSRRRDMANLRGLFDYLVFRAVVPSNPTIGVEPPRIQAVVPTAQLRDELAIIADALDRNALDSRASLVISLMFGEGLRRCEIARLQLEDVDSDAGVIRIRGKDGYRKIARVLALSDRTARALEAYGATIGRQRGPLIYNYNSPERGVSVAHVGIIARRALESLGIKRSGGDGVTPHSLLFDAGRTL